MDYLKKVRSLVNNEKGAELVEWAIWVGAVAAAAVAIGATMQTTLSTVMDTLLNSLTTTAGS